MLEIFRQTFVDRMQRLPATGAAIFFLGLQFYFTFRGAVNEVPVIVIVIVFACSGMIGVDVSQGLLHVLLTRPVTRNRYLAGRAVGTLAVGIFWLVMNALVTFVARAAGGAPLGAEKTFMLHVNWGLALIWAWALLFLCSCVLRSFFDALGVASLLAAGQSLTMLASIAKRPWVSHAAQFLGENMTNSLYAFDSIQDVNPVAALRYVSNIAVVLLAGTLIFNRRDFSYGHD